MENLLRYKEKTVAIEPSIISTMQELSFVEMKDENTIELWRVGEKPQNTKA